MMPKYRPRIGEYWERLERAGYSRDDVRAELRAIRDGEDDVTAEFIALQDHRRSTLDDLLRARAEMIRHPLDRLTPPDIREGFEELAETAKRLRARLAVDSFILPDAPTESPLALDAVNHWALLAELRRNVELTWYDCAVIWLEFERTEADYPDVSSDQFWWEKREGLIEARQSLLQKWWAKAPESVRKPPGSKR